MTKKLRISKLTRNTMTTTMEMTMTKMTIKWRSSKLTRNKEWRKIPNLWFRHNSDFQTNHSQSFDGEEGLELSGNVFGVEGHDISSLTRGVVGLEIRSSFSLGVGVGKNRI